jgi:NAD(P)-dependent dehydrogenase (short-subunit alcohol dehydrogenase family)
MSSSNERLTVSDSTAAATHTQCRRLDGSVAIVTGAAHGVGVAYARRLASEGAAVVVADLDGVGAEQVSSAIKADGGRALPVTADIAEEDAVRDMVKAAVAEFGTVTALVNNAAMFSVVPMSRVGFDRIEPDEWDRLMAVNIKGTWLSCRAVAPVMRDHGYGKIVNISSTTALCGSTTRIHYVTAKAAIIGFTRSLARELGPDGITVNCIAPGGTLSEENPDEATLARRAAALGDRALRRVQMPADLVGALAFLVSPDSDFITGQTLVVDGGSVML